jgi:hypothetical protein
LKHLVVVFRTGVDHFKYAAPNGAKQRPLAAAVKRIGENP